MVQVDGSDYLGRIGILSIALWIAHFVNRVYIQRLEENESQIKFQKMISEVSTEFVKISDTNLDEKIYGMLKLSGEHFQVDRTFFINSSENLKTYEWCNEGIEPAISIMSKLTKESFPWLLNQMLNNDLVNIADTEMLPAEAIAEKTMLKYHNIKSMYSIAVKNKGRILGFLFFASVKKAKILQENHKELLKILANLMSDAMVKIETDKEISYMAYYDALTQLPNYTMFKNLLDQEIHLSRQTEKLIGVIFIDLDSFKIVNDTIGHLGGDEMLKLVTTRLSKCLHKDDTISRFGGDEFLIKLTQIDRVEDIIKVADKIMDSFSQPVNIRGQEFFVTASTGIAVYPVDGDDTETLIKNADLAMYSSKDKGKNQYSFCSPDMKENVVKKMQLTNSLYRAQERNELVLYYQPQVSVSTKEIVGLEALIRWNNPDLGLISPATFIPLAEQTGLINPIGQWVLETACRQIKQWQVMGLPHLRIAVNLSIEQFRDRNLVSLIKRILSETGLESKYLELEITESTAVDGSDNITKVLYKLKELGVSISIDDFGTEYSSLSRLKTLPVDRIKIDMQFVHGISEGNKDEAIAKTIIQLAKNLELKVIAEGVETETQFEFFNKNMCDEIQGYFFYKPMPALEIEALLLNK